jgi:hypothetical protein
LHTVFNSFFIRDSLMVDISTSDWLIGLSIQNIGAASLCGSPEVEDSRFRNVARV